MTKKHEVRAQKRVAKALGVFSKAVAEVEKAQLILEDGIATDIQEVDRLNAQVKEIEEAIAQANYRKIDKMAQMTNNIDLLAKLNHFNTEEQ